MALVEILIFLLDAIIEIIFAFGFERRADAYGRPLFKYSILTYVGLTLLGACVGALLSQLVPQQIWPAPAIRGVSLLLSPLAGGLIMRLFGRWRVSKGHQPNAIATFWGGAAFAFGVALVRWLMVGQPA